MPSLHVLQDPERLPSALAGPVLAIGNFDGVHRGHKTLLAETKRLAAHLGKQSGLLSFEPHPRAVMRPDVPMFRLTSIEDRNLILARLGIDLAIIETFDEALRAMTPDVFAADLLRARFGVSGIVVGPDFRYGRGRVGDVTALRDAGRRLGFEVSVTDAVAGAGGEPVSSSAIRVELAAGDVLAAANLLGHFWFLHAEVQHGDKRGRLLGFPTANLHLPISCGLAWGIYAVRARIAGRMVDGVASFGSRPTFDDGPPKLEVFLFDFSGDLYGQRIGVEFVARLRGEQKFSSLEALVDQMNADCRNARMALSDIDVSRAASMLT